MIDCHSHILPHFDDGAKNVETSVEMLERSLAQGVEGVISTSHCYPKHGGNILDFIDLRNDRIKQLKEGIKESGKDVPQIYLGCELNMLTDVSEYEQTRLVCINDTDYILIEMPFTPWKEWMIDAVYKLTVRGYKPIMAHIDRFLGQDRNMLNALYGLDVLYQINTEAFLTSSISKSVSELLMHGRAHVLGTDMHNLTDRSPNMGKAISIIKKNYGEECVKYFNDNAKKIISGQTIEDSDIRTFKRKNIVDKIFHKKD